MKNMNNKQRIELGSVKRALFILQERLNIRFNVRIIVRLRFLIHLTIACECD